MLKLRRPATGREPDEGGFVVVLVAITVVVTLAFAAIAVDLGNARQQRRQAQNAVDGAALAAARELVDVTQTPAAREAAAVNVAKAYATKTFGPLTWTGCHDTAALALQPDAGNDDTCVSIDATLTSVRVRLPVDRVSTSFGGVVGVPTLYVTAAATAAISTPGGNRVLPVAITTGTGTGNLCLENSGNNTGCASRSSGNFGDLQSPRLYRYLTGSASDALRIDYADGVDHPLSIHLPGDPAICDGDLTSPCGATNVGTSSIANYMNTTTGNATNEPGDGLVTGFSVATSDAGTVTFCGHLARPDTTPSNRHDPYPAGCDAVGSPSHPTTSVLGHNVTARHVSYYLTPQARAVFYPALAPTDPSGDPGLSHPDYSTAAFAAGSPSGDDNLDCFIRHYRFNGPGSETLPTIGPGGQCSGLHSLPARPIFATNILADPRFGYIPVLHAWPPGGSQAEPADGYLPCFLYRMYTNGGGTKLDAVDGWVFDPALLPSGTDTSTGSLPFEGGPAVISLLN